MSAPVPTIRHRLSQPGSVIPAVTVTSSGEIWAIVTDEDGSSVVRCHRPAGATALAALQTAVVYRSDSILTALAPATADSVWAASPGDGAVVRIDHRGARQTVASSNQGGRPIDVVGLDDGTAWFTEPDLDAISRIDLMGRVSSFRPGQAGSAPTRITAVGDSLWVVGSGIDGVWFIRGGDSAPVTHRIEGAAHRDTLVAADGTGAVWVAVPALSARSTPDAERPDAELPDANSIDASGQARIVRLGRGGITHETTLPAALGTVLAIAGASDGGCAVAGSAGAWMVEPPANDPQGESSPSLVVSPLPVSPLPVSPPNGETSPAAASAGAPVLDDQGPRFTAVASAGGSVSWIAGAAGELVEL